MEVNVVVPIAAACAFIWPLIACGLFATFKPCCCCCVKLRCLLEITVAKGLRVDLHCNVCGPFVPLSILTVAGGRFDEFKFEFGQLIVDVFIPAPAPKIATFLLCGKHIFPEFSFEV